jgi:hypothetical protein
LTGCTGKEYTDTPQSIGGYMVFKKSPKVKAFFEEVLEYAQDIRIISDNRNVMGMTNYYDFITHRHDQSVISLISKKYCLKRFKDPSQFGEINHYEPEVEKRSTYPQIIDSHRYNVAHMWEIRFRRIKAITVIERLFKKVKNKITNRR